jgi:mRNA interferase MazF
MLAVVPLTGTPGEGALYPSLRPGKSGLRKPSWALIDQLRTIDKRRVTRVFGAITPVEQAAIDDGMRLFLGLSAPAAAL